MYDVGRKIHNMSQMVEISKGRFVNMSHVMKLEMGRDNWGDSCGHMVMSNGNVTKITMLEYNKMLAAIMADTLSEKEKV